MFCYNSSRTCLEIELADTLEITEPLILDLVEWIAARPRPYEDVMDAWRTSCPRLTIWEDAVDRGLIVREEVAGAGARVKLTHHGRKFLEKHGRLPGAT